MGDRPHKAFPDGEFTDSDMKEMGNTNALTNQEAKIVLKQFQDRNKKSYADWTATSLTQKAWDYLEKVEPKTEMSHSESVSRLREGLTDAGIYEYEMALLANLTPETAEEAMTLIPSLRDEQRFAGEEGKQTLQNVLDDILTLKELQ